MLDEKRFLFRRKDKQRPLCLISRPKDVRTVRILIILPAKEKQISLVVEGNFCSLKFVIVKRCDFSFTIRFKTKGEDNNK